MMGSEKVFSANDQIPLSSLSALGPPNKFSRESDSVAQTFIEDLLYVRFTAKMLWIKKNDKLSSLPLSCSWISGRRQAGEWCVMTEASKWPSGRMHRPWREGPLIQAANELQECDAFWKVAGTKIWERTFQPTIESKWMIRMPEAAQEDTDCYSSS